MKKTKKIVASLLSLLMCGSFALTGCNIPGLGSSSGTNSLPDLSESVGGNSGSESVGGNSGSESAGSGEVNDGDPASKNDKTTFFASVKELGMSAMLPGTKLKVTLDLDMEAIMGGEAVAPTAATAEITPKMGVLALDGTAYYTMDATDGLPFVDATISGSMIPSNAPYMYAAAYMRGDDLYASSKMSTTEITDTSDMKYSYYTVSALMEQIMSQMGGSGDSGDNNGSNVESENGQLPPKQELARDASAGDGAASMMAMVAEIAEKAISGAFNGLSSTVKEEGGVKTLTINLKTEAQKLLIAANLLVQSIDTESTVADLLASQALEDLYNAYFADLTAEELNTALTLVASLLVAAPAPTDDAGITDGAEGGFDITTMIPLPNQGEEAYDYLVRVISALQVPMGEEQTPTAIGSISVAPFKQMLTGYIAQASAALTMVNSAKVSLQMTNGVFSGVIVDFDLKDTADIDLAVGIAVVTDYTFVDVDELPEYAPEQV